MNSIFYFCIDKGRYSVCRGFRLMKRDVYFESLVTTYDVSIIF